MVKKAVQQFMLGSVLKNEASVRETLAAIKTAGYDSIELCGFMLHPMGFMIRMLTKAAGMPVGSGGNLDWERLIKESGLNVVSIHQDLGSIERDPVKVAEEAKRFDTDTVVITGMYRYDYSSEAAVRDLARRLNEAGKVMKARGIRLLYHNHNCEFLRVAPGISGYALLIAETDPEYVNFEFDSYWCAECGADPLLVMDALGTRMKLWHINDRGTRQAGSCMTPILKSDSMELGTGTMPLNALWERAKEAGVETVILESHRNWVEKSPIKSMEVSAKWLTSHMAGAGEP